MEPSQRNTRQKTLILGCLKQRGAEHVTADDIADLLKKSGSAVAKSTVYRALAQLEQSGDVRKYLIAEGQPSCYQFVDKDGPCGEHYHMVCQGCGQIVHFECAALAPVFAGLRGAHGFSIDAGRTVFHGRCASCARERAL